MNPVCVFSIIFLGMRVILVSDFQLVQQLIHDYLIVIYAYDKGYS